MSGVNVVWNSPLTPRQLRVVKLVAKGMSNPEIAKQLKMSLSTVKNIMVQLLDKTGSENRMQLAFWQIDREVKGRKL